MEDKEFKEQYKKAFDSICASEALKANVKNMSPRSRRHVITPFKATIGTVAAAVMIFAAVGDYSFDKDTSGVISETVVSTQLPEAQFEIVEKKPGKVSPTPKTQKDMAVVVTPAPVTKAVSEPAKAEIPAEEIPTVDNEPASFSVDGPSPRSIGDEYVPPAVEKWTLGKYYEYLGTDVSQKIAGVYTGAGEFEFEVGQDGLPLDDTAVLNFAMSSGAMVRITVSKLVLFDASLSGTVTEAGSGYNAYKVSNGVYYNLYATNTTKDSVTELINNL